MAQEDSDVRLLIPLQPGPDGVGHVLGGISRSTIYQLIAAGHLVRVKIGQRVFVTAASIAAYVETLSDTSSGQGENTGVA